MGLKVCDIARIFKVSETTVFQWIDEGGMPVYRVGEQYRFNRGEILEWAASRGLQVSPGILREPESEGAPPALLVEALEAGGIYYGVRGGDKESALRNAVGLMRLPEGSDRGILLDALLARERLASTGIGNGVAIPHVRGPIIPQVTCPTIALCFLSEAVEFGTLDGKPVHAIFIMLSPTVRAHLNLLSRLSFALRDSGFDEVIQRRGSWEEIIREARRVEDSLGRAPGSRGKHEDDLFRPP